MWNCTKNLIFPSKLLKTGFGANDKWRQAPGFDLLHHKFEKSGVKNKDYLYLTFL